MPAPPPWLSSKPPSSTSQASYCEPKSPIIKVEPGTEGSPEAMAMSSSAKTKTRSESHSGTPLLERKNTESVRRLTFAQEKEVVASETWQYINGLTPVPIPIPVFPSAMRVVLQLPRQRDLPEAWKLRLASEKLSYTNLALLINYLNGDAPKDILCNSSAASCAEKWRSVVPAIASLEEGKGTIYKDGAFPRCVFLPIVKEEHQASSKRICCNAFYRDSDSPSTPGIWSPPNPTHIPVPSPVFSSSSPAASSSEYSPEPPTAVERALPENLDPEIPSHQPHHEAQAQQETGYLADLWEQRNEAMYLSGPINVSTSYVHSAGWFHQREGQVLPIGTDGATLQILDLENKGATVPLPSGSQNLLCIVFEGTVEVILQDTPVFTPSRGGQWSVGVGKECRVRNPRIGTKAVLYNIGAPVKQNDE
ncbi:hypothetical protein NEUTE2DRAFT_58081 [Neurospora tetrasperma FGSC 2509]|nr:hypothetical protein NEUTE2DRAFT_58081 [Neurospora tetrasperma FGSC 2509]